jgi:hypothetical protein
LPALVPLPLGEDKGEGSRTDGESFNLAHQSE